MRRSKYRRASRSNNWFSGKRRIIAVAATLVAFGGIVTVTQVSNASTDRTQRKALSTCDKVQAPQRAKLSSETRRGTYTTNNGKVTQHPDDGAGDTVSTQTLRQRCRTWVMNNVGNNGNATTPPTEQATTAPAADPSAGAGNGDQGAGNGDNGQGNGDQGAGNGDQGAGNGDQGAGNGDQGAGNGDQGAGNGDQGAGNGDQGAGNGDQGAGNGDQGAGNGDQGAGNGDNGQGNGDQGGNQPDPQPTESQTTPPPGAGLGVLTNSCDTSQLSPHTGFQEGSRCVSTEFGEVGEANANPSLLITNIPRSVAVNQPFTITVSTRNLIRDRFLAAGQGGYYVESSVLANGLVRGHFHTACRMLANTNEAPAPDPVPAFFVATEDSRGGATPDSVQIQVPGLPTAGTAQCASWAGDGSHRIPMMVRANQTPAFDVARVQVRNGGGGRGNN
ncbi:Pecanex-like protein 1 [Actinoplanes bogorensis]|uniref:Pecanex-like protein 1 n=1 Tax=Paractinoplanes bogorensis TaxID=1610840 RepID=A0ABS5YGE5_9ACTN|nr:Pecanex-like protein 1 [Actinoplanes bogorensis]MBU2662438.1 Pecanex-like protein 1 [Actinoplanes bogorensis]